MGEKYDKPAGEPSDAWVEALGAPSQADHLCGKEQGPMVSVPLAVLERAAIISLGGVLPSDKVRVNAAREVIQDAIAERRREINEPAPSPWNAHNPPGIMSDAQGRPLAPKDVLRACMAPELAKTLRHVTEHGLRNDIRASAVILLRNFDTPKE